MIVGQQQDKKSGSPEPFAFADEKGTDGLPSYVAIEDRTLLRHSKRATKVRRFAKLSVLAITSIYLLHTFSANPFALFSEGEDGSTHWAGRSKGKGELLDVTDEWVGGTYDYLMVESMVPYAAQAVNVIDTSLAEFESEDPFQEDPPSRRPPGPPHRPPPGPPPGPPHEPPHGPPRPPPGAPPRKPHHRHPHGPKGPHRRPGPHPRHPPHHVTVECVSDENEANATPFDFDLPYDPQQSFLDGPLYDTEASGFDRHLSFNLSAALPHIVLAAKGPVVGSVEYSVDDELDGDVHIDVSVADDSIKVCKLMHRGVFFGVGLVSGHHPHVAAGQAKVHVYFPASSVNAFTAHMGIFKHNVTNLSKASFRRFELGASNANISVEVLNSKSVAFTTSNSVIHCGVMNVSHLVAHSSNGAIDGTFMDVTHSLIMTTTNAPIHFKATLSSSAEARPPRPQHDDGDEPTDQVLDDESNDGDDSDEDVAESRRPGWLPKLPWSKPDGAPGKPGRKGPKSGPKKPGCGRHGGRSRRDNHPHRRRGHGRGEAKAIAVTSNGRVEAGIYLKSNSTGVFGVTANTRNAPISLQILDQPVNSTLSLAASSSNGRAEVSLHPAYEGDFIAQTSNGKTELVQTPDVEDPSGLDRSRIVNVNRVAGVLTGSIAWGEAKKRGGVVVHTSNGGIKLIV